MVGMARTSNERLRGAHRLIRLKRREQAQTYGAHVFEYREDIGSWKKLGEEESCVKIGELDF